MNFKQWSYYKKWTFLRSPLVEAWKANRMNRYWLDRYTGIRHASPYWATPEWRRYLRDKLVPNLVRLFYPKHPTYTEFLLQNELDEYYEKYKTNSK